ncbi:hypothetical protein [Thermomonas haemolytica]|uniref:AsmA-like protein n=1 Tax=Thermomonas haemolytica TaxID=141949 RepID=A0A4V2V2S9_9GAMM|nr:hypothetical protein [Thermomonas haemolytica]TCT26232.1 hypothetical protein EDC34_101560 [Thermomonas haemolytica]TNY29528.1 hypothetical protein BV505_04805 [Thermomonas haemolytica]
MSAALPAGPRPRRWLRLAALAIVLALALLLLLMAWLAPAPRAGRALLALAGDALALDLEADGFDYRLRGTPQLELRGLVAREPGAARALLRARRVFVALPWRTLRTRGTDLTVQRIELDAPVLDLPALQHWLAGRPPGETRLPTLVAGLRVRDGRIDNDDWRIEALAIDLPALHPRQVLHLNVRGRYAAGTFTLPAALALSLDTPQRLLERQPAQLSARGRLEFSGEGWRMPAQVFLAGPLRIGRDSALMQPVRLGLDARYQSAGGSTAFRLGLAAPMAFNDARWRFVPASVVLEGDPQVPRASARGSLRLGARLRLQLTGEIAAWPPGWPPLPAPLHASSTPLSFTLAYDGAPDASGPARLTLRRDATALEAGFRLPEMLAWLDAGGSGSPLPPLAGTLTTPHLVLDGVTLDGVQVQIDDAP